MKYNNILFKKYDAYTIVCQMVVCIFLEHTTSQFLIMIYIYDVPQTESHKKLIFSTKEMYLI